MSTSYFRKRHPRGLLWVWSIAAAVTAALYWVSQAVPALGDLIAPIYWLIAIAAVGLTIHWFQPRTGNRRSGDRRARERRESDED